MSKKTVAAEAAELETNLINFFGTSFFQPVEIFDLTERPLYDMQLAVGENEPKGYTGSQNHRYLTTVAGRIVRQLEGEKPEIFSNSQFFAQTIRKLELALGSKNLTCHFMQYDHLSASVTVAFKKHAIKLFKNATVYPAIWLQNSLTGLFAPRVRFCFQHQDLPGALIPWPLFAKMSTAEILELSPQAIESQVISHSAELVGSFRPLVETETTPFHLVEFITDQILNLGCPKKLAREAHPKVFATMEGAPALNYYHVYAGFNHAIYCEYSMPFERREILEQKIFQYLTTNKPS